MIYLLCFAVSILFAYFANRTTNKKYIWLFSAISILVPAVLAGLRDYSIGIDTSNYLNFKYYWGYAASADSLWAYMKYYIGSGYGEPLFALLCGSIAQTFGNYSVLLFVIHVIIITCVYIGAYRFRDHVSPVFVLLLFYLAFYNQSLNIMRQYIAMSIIFAALADIPKKKYLRYSLFVLLAFLFHNSALLGFGAVVIHWFISFDKTELLSKWKGIFTGMERIFRKKSIPKAAEGNANDTRVPVRKHLESDRRIDKSTVLRRQIILFSLLLLLVFLFNPLCRLMINLGLLNKKYLWYLDMSKAQHSTLITLFLLVEMVPLVWFRKIMQKRSPLFDFFFTNSGAYLILHQLSAFLNYGKRVASYFSLANLITIAMIPRIYKEKKYRAIAYLIVGGIVFFYWFYVYILRNSSRTYPYIFIFS